MRHVFLLLALLLLPACKHAAEEEVETTEAVPVKVARATAGAIRPVIAASGQVKPAAGAELLVSPPQEARIAELPKSVGDRVRRGDLLVRFEVPSLEADAATKRADLARAEAQLTTARQTAERLSGLYERGIAARKDVEDARRDLVQAEATVAEARSAVAATARLAQRAVVRAPFDGVVAGRSHEPGDLVEPGGAEPILRLIDPSRLQVEAAVPAVELGPVAVGSPARVHGASYPDEQARVIARPATVDSATGTALVRLEFVAPTRLPAGMAVDVEIHGEEHAAAILVPADALVREGSQSFVYTVDAEKKAHRREVKAGVIAGDRAEILSGITAGEQVVVSGQTALPDGAAVEPAPVNLARISERQGRAVVLVTLLLAGAGAVVLLSLPSDIYPPLQFPRLLVIAHSGSLPARTMMTAVTRPLEQAAMEVPGIRRVRSRTFRGATEISALFVPETDMALALQELQNRVAEVRQDLPADTELAVERLTVSAFPMLSLNLTGGLPTPDLYDYAFYVIRPAMARVPGVGRVEVAATDTREIEVATDPDRLLAAALTVDDVVTALRASNRLAPVGRYAAGGMEHLVLASGLWGSAGEIARTPVAVRNGATVRVADVATVFPGAPDRTTLITGNGRDAAVISISQQPGASILDVKAGIEKTLQDLVHTLPSGLRLSKVYDLADFVATAIANVRDAILIGGALAVLVLLLFLRDWRVTLIASITLPLTVLSTFLFMRMFDESINLMSMGGLAVAIGLVIDDAVVMVENIHRRLRGGRGEAAIEEATEELIAPVVGSTLTTVVVLAPLGFLSGVVGQFFRALSLTLSVSVLISLVLSLTLIPLLSRFAYRHGEHARNELPGRVERFYVRALGASLARPRLALVAALVLAVVGYLLYRGMPSGFLPPMDEGGFVLDYQTPPGTALAETDRQVRKVEAVIAKTPEVAAFSRRTGAELGLFATQPNTGDILVRLKPRSDRDRSSEEVIAGLRPQLAEEVPGMDLEFVQLLQDMIGDLEGAAEPLEVKIFGDDAATLDALAEKVKAEIEGVEGVVDVVGPMQGAPETTWRILPEAAGRAGLTIEQVQAQLAEAWLGETATDLQLGDRSIPVRVRFRDSDRFDPARQARLTLKTPDGRLVPLSSVARQEVATGNGELTRENLRQVALVTGRLEGQDLGSAASEIQARLRQLKLPVGYTAEVGGQYETQRQAFRELLLVFATAAALVLLVLVVEFRALTPALILLLAAPLSFAGAFLLLRLAGSALDVSSAMGLILLIGLAVKNGIVMIDYAHRLHKEGEPFVDSIAHAARVRLRPILMTTLCTLFGLLPLALGLGAGAELQKPLALAVIGGLGFSTLVTLFAVPSAYVALRRKESGE